MGHDENLCEKKKRKGRVTASQNDVVLQSVQSFLSHEILFGGIWPQNIEFAKQTLNILAVTWHFDVPHTWQKFFYWYFRPLIPLQEVAKIDHRQIFQISFL